MFCIKSDGDHTRYIIPVEKRAEFAQRMEDIAHYWDMFDDDENAPKYPPEVPDYAIEVDGPVSRVAFPSFVFLP